jgi:hypothetical protein
MRHVIGLPAATPIQAPSSSRGSDPTAVASRDEAGCPDAAEGVGAHRLHGPAGPQRDTGATPPTAATSTTPDGVESATPARVSRCRVLPPVQPELVGKRHRHDQGLLRDHRVETALNEPERPFTSRRAG